MGVKCENCGTDNGITMSVGKTCTKCGHLLDWKLNIETKAMNEGKRVISDGVCDQCGVHMNHDFSIDKEIWKKAWKKSGIDKEDGVLCANCCLDNLGYGIWHFTEWGADDNQR